MRLSPTRRLRLAGGRLSDYGSWIACCLSRGEQAPLTQRDVDDLVADFGESLFAGGMFVFRCGDRAAQVHVVRTGMVELSRVTNGRRVALQILHPGDVFGDVPAFLGELEPFDARAVNDCAVLSLDVSALFAMLQTRPHVARRWIVSLAERMSGLHLRLGDLLAGSLEAQLASIVLREGINGRHVTLTQDQLAEMLGAARTSIHRVLKHLEHDGLIELGYRRIKVIDVAGLSELVNGT